MNKMFIYTSSENYEESGDGIGLDLLTTSYQPCVSYPWGSGLVRRKEQPFKTHLPWVSEECPRRFLGIIISQYSEYFQVQQITSCDDVSVFCLSIWRIFHRFLYNYPITFLKPWTSTDRFICDVAVGQFSLFSVSKHFWGTFISSWGPCLQHFIWHASPLPIRTCSKGHFTHEPRAVTVKLWEPKRKCQKAVPTHLQDHLVWSRTLNQMLFQWIPIHGGPPIW